LKLQVEKGESLLKELLTALDKGKPQEELQRLSDEFYVEIPHHPQHCELLNSKRLLAKKQDLCQVINTFYRAGHNSAIVIYILAIFRTRIV
jgi:hypothetical protein